MDARVRTIGTGTEPFIITIIAHRAHYRLETRLAI
jgi:hypothetical protein